MKLGEIFLDYINFILRRKPKHKFKEGDKVLYDSDSYHLIRLRRGPRIYDFGYINSKGKAVIYEEGEINMQVGCVVDINKLEKVVKNG